MGACPASQPGSRPRRVPWRYRPDRRVGAHLVDLHDVGVAQRARHKRFPAETIARRRFRAGRQHLQRHGPPGYLVISLIDDRSPAAAQPALYQKPADLPPCQIIPGKAQFRTCIRVELHYLTHCIECSSHFGSSPGIPARGCASPPSIGTNHRRQ